MYSTLLRTTALLSIISITSGCSYFPKFPKAPEPIPVEIRTIEVRVPITHPIMPRAIDLKEPMFYVVSDKNLEEFLVDMEKQNGSVVFIAMTVDDYELMSYNMQEIRRYVNQLKEVVVYYRTINTDEKKPVDNQNEEQK